MTAGVLKPGDSLPSIRQLANDLELNSKTVAKAYQLLTRDSIIETKGYRGTYVHPKAKSNCKFNLRSTLYTGIASDVYLPIFFTLMLTGLHRWMPFAQSTFFVVFALLICAPFIVPPPESADERNSDPVSSAR